MPRDSAARDPAVGDEDRAALRQLQEGLLRQLLRELYPSNRFYAPRLEQAGLHEGEPGIDEFVDRMPFTTKAEMVEAQQQQPPYGSNLTYPLERYSRLHQTSGTSGGEPLRWLDTPQSWSSLLDTWERVFRVAGVQAGDRVFVPFSFGPFLGFWTAFEAAARMGCLAIPGGGLSSEARLRVMHDNRVTVLCATPTYALHLAEVANKETGDRGELGLRTLIVAGEPGGSVPAARERLSQAWGGAKVWDHHGMTEVGPVSYPNDRFADVLHVREEAFLAEVIDPQSGRAVNPGEVGELVLTTLLRPGSPLLRYRTGDLVRPSQRLAAELGERDLALDGGILARVDDMEVVRGVNLYPSAVEQVLRSQPGVAEYQVIVDRREALAEVEVTVEALPTVEPDDLARRVARDLHNTFQLRIPVRGVGPGSLPRFELKARRWRRQS